MSVSIETTQVPTAPMTSQPVLLGQQARMPEFSLAGKVVLVSGAGRGLGLTQSEALLEAGAKVYALDRLEEPASEFFELQARAKELGTELQYRRIDVRDTELLNSVIEGIAQAEGRMDGLVAAAGIQQETPALEYSAKDSNTMFEVNVTGVFMTAQAVAKQMIRFGNGGSIAMIASMSGTIANRVSSPSSTTSILRLLSSSFLRLSRISSIPTYLVRLVASLELDPSVYLPPPPQSYSFQPLFESRLTGDYNRALFVPPTTPPRLPLSNLVATSLPNGASTIFVSTPSPRAISSLPWLRSCLLSSLSAAISGLRKTCSAACLVPRSIVVQQSSCSPMPLLS